MAAETKHTAMRFKQPSYSKAAYIAWLNRETITDVVNNAIDDAIAKFEKKNGEITEEQIRNAIKKK